MRRKPAKNRLLWNESASRNNKRNIWIYTLCATAIGAAVFLLSKTADGFAEWYAVNVFPLFASILGRLFSLLPFSVFEIIVCAALLILILFAVILAAGTVVAICRKILEKRFSRQPSDSAVRRAARARANAMRYNDVIDTMKSVTALGLRLFLIVASTAFMMTSLTCLVNYERETFATLTEQTVAPATEEELLLLGAHLIAQAEALALEISVDENGLFTMADLDVRKESVAAMRKLGEKTPPLSGYVPNPKPVFLSKGMSALGLTGIYSPITIEANYNRDVVDHIIPYTICHELAHLKGFMREDEAGFIAYLACMESETPAFRYSGTLNALRYVLNTCYREVGAEAYTRLQNRIPDQVRRDMLANSAYWRQFQGRPTTISSRANDAYLRANAQEDGIGSYDRMIDLLVAKYRDTWE